MNDNSHRLARRLVEIGAVSFSPDVPYTWASGLKSPMYCDNRLTLAYPDIRSLIARSFQDLFADNGFRPEALVGVATGAIAHAAVLSERLSLPMGYVRAVAKQHGKKNQIEGFARPGSRIVVVEDLISTGGSSIAAARAVSDAGLVVEAVTAIFSYGFPMAEQAFEEAGVVLRSILHLRQLMDAAREAGTLDASHDATLLEWMHDPVRWSDLRSTED